MLYELSQDKENFEKWDLVYYLEDGSQVEIPMQMAEPVQPIWMVDIGIGELFGVYGEIDEGWCRIDGWGAIVDLDMLS